MVANHLICNAMICSAPSIANCSAMFITLLLAIATKVMAALQRRLSHRWLLQLSTVASPAGVAISHYN